MKASRSMDLVQDAATDCSVVASMCAGIARTERGHDQVGPSNLYANGANDIDALQHDLAL